MTFLNFRSTLAVFGLISTIALVTNTASARGSVHVDLPGLSIGYQDNHYRPGRAHKRAHKRAYKRRHHRSHRGHNYRGYYNRHNDYNYRDYGRSQNGYGYYDQGYRSYDYKSRGRNYNRGNYCPTAGYSEYGYRNRNCSRHEDHFHCS